MKHLFTLNARFIRGFVLIFILIITFNIPSKSNGLNDAGITNISSPANIFCEGNYSIIATLKNFGTGTIKNCVLNWAIVGVTSSSQSFTGNLKPDSSVSVNLGTYSFTAGNVTLQVWSSSPNGKIDSFPNNDTMTEMLNVLANASAYTGPPFRICSGLQATIGGSSTAGYLYNWTSNPSGFSSNVSNPTITPYSTTTYYLTVKNLSGCTATDSVVVTVDQTPNGYAGPDQQVCSGLKITLGLPAISGHTYFWTSSPSGFSSSQANPTVTPPYSITYFLTEYVPATGCSNSHQCVITVLPKATKTPIAGLQNVCPGTSSIYVPSFQTSGYNYLFRFGDSTGSTGNSFIQSFDTAYVKWGTPGKVTIWLTSQNIAGCEDSSNYTITITSPPIANFKSTENCAKLATSFTNTSGSAVTAKWNYGDALAAGTNRDTASGLKSSHIYQTGGNYKVKLKVANIAGCTDSVIQSVIVDSLPKVSFADPKTICVNSASLFINTSFSPTDSFLWLFGDGSIDSVPSHTYTQSGTYRVELSAINQLGCKDTFTKSVIVNPLPSAKFTGSQWTSRNFNFKATDTTEANYSWDFGDTTALGTGFKISHSYAHNGLYMIKQNVTNIYGCSATTDTVINVKLNGINYKKILNEYFDIYPNPFENYTQIKYTISEKSNTQILINDITGKLIANILNSSQDPGNYIFMINASSLELKPGIYFINAIIDGANISRQIIKME